MKKLLSLAFLIVPLFSYSQCANSINIYTFTYQGKTYELVKENKTWKDAAACAVSRGGYLAEINNASEQTAIYTEVSQNAGIVLSNTTAPDGGGASYVWLGGNDLANEGTWIWDGNDDGNGTPFWQGNASGNPLNNAYTNWGNEPDNYNNQDALGLALTEWPLGIGSLGSPGQWNDIDANNTLYYVIEYNTSTNISSEKDAFLITYPNPVQNVLHIATRKTIASVRIFDLLGQEKYLRNIDGNSYDLEKLPAGIYYLKISFPDGNSTTRRLIKY